MYHIEYVKLFLTNYCLPDNAEVREWTSFIPDNVTFKNAYRVRKLKEEDDEQRPVPHSFTFLPRSGQTRCFNILSFLLSFDITSWYNLNP